MYDEVKNKELHSLVEEKKFRLLRDELSNMNEFDIAEFMGELDAQGSLIVFRMLPKEMASSVFAFLEPENKEHIISSITDKELSFIIEELYLDDAVDMLEELPANVVKKVINNANPSTRTLINQFLKYPANSAGTVMTAEYIGLRKSMTVAEAFDYIRKHGVDKETIYTCYVMDAKRILEGVVTIKEMLINSDDTLLGDIMDSRVVKAVTNTDREELIEIFNKYSLIALPIVDHENRLVGIVTIDDVVDVMEEEATEDFEKMAAMLPSEKPYLKTGVVELAKNRIIWLIVLMISDMLTGGILSNYEQAFVVLPILVTFVPMIMGTGGNAGSQSSTMVIRGMAVGEIEPKDAFKVIMKEGMVSVLVGLVLGIVNFIRLVIMYPGQYMIALTVMLSLLGTVIMAKIVGGVLPLIAKLFKADPALMAAPLITTIVDAFSLIIYFQIAVRLLGELK